MSDILYPLRRLHGALSRRKKEYFEKREFSHCIQSAENAAFLMGTPAHTNIGDSAIVMAETEFLKKLFTDTMTVKELTVPECRKYRALVERVSSPSIRFFWHGGGNMGDQWFSEEAFRRAFIVDQLNNRPVVFPQTIFYSDTQDGKSKERESAAVYNDPSITLAAREKTSFAIMQRLYPKANVLLTPDIVLSTTAEDYGVVQQERSGVLFCVRSDAEKSVPDFVWTELENTLADVGKKTIRTDMYSDCPVTKENRRECVRKKMQEFCGAELVITDRLHGMIFAAITGTPCVAFSNNNHKVKGTYDWISYLPYISYAESEDEAKKVIPELLKMKDCRFDNTPLLPYFEKLAEVVKSYAED